MTPENEKKPDTLFYDGSYQPVERDQAIRKKHNRTPLSPYLPGPDLVQAVELAIFLKRPLLLRGEPGCGKSMLLRGLARLLKPRRGSTPMN